MFWQFYLCAIFISVFKLNAVEASICGQTFNGSFTNGSFTSPGWPNPYTTNQDCQWIIITPPDTYIKLNITDFELQTGGFNDFVRVKRANEDDYDGCGGSVFAPIVLYSYGNSTTIEFKSDGNDLSAAKGFRAEFHVLKPVCPPSHLSDLTGTITSPNFPDFYPVNIHCSINITVPQGYRIELEFSLVDVQYSANCTEDSITVLTSQYNGFLICGKPTLPLAYMASEDSTMIVRFKTDGKTTYQGFNASYKAVSKTTPITTVMPTSTPTPKTPDHYSSLFVPVPNRALSGSILNKLNTPSNIACVMLCQRNILCKSVTYKASPQSTGLCILHSKEGTPDDLSDQSDTVYYRLIP